MLVDDFDFELPSELIAQAPIYPREAARLLHVSRQGDIKDYRFASLKDLLRAGDLLVFNRSRVIPARLFGLRLRGDSQAHIETTLTEKMSDCTWLSYSKPGKRINVDDLIDYGNGLQASVLSKNGPEVTLKFHHSGADLIDLLDKIGSMPLPPYIKRERGGVKQDLVDYQPFLAKDPGSVAAPTASLHFDQEGVDKLVTEVGIETAEVTLHVGLGTFAPIRVHHTQDHVMHFERCAIDAVNVQRIRKAKEQGRRIIAIGTTVLRTLESLHKVVKQGQEADQRTNLFITPGYHFNIVDALVTNFHLPKSTLFMLVCAFSGKERMFAAYKNAIDQQYRFFSYGDGCFLERASQ